MSAQGHDPATAGPPPGPPATDKRLWVVAGLLAVVAVVAIAILVFSPGDDGDEELTTDATTTTETAPTTTDDEVDEVDEADDPSTSSTDPTPTTDAPTPTTEGPTPTTAPDEGPPVTADPAQCRDVASDTDPEYPAQAVFIAWTRNDRSCAQQLMTAEAFDQLFARDGSQARDEFQGCTEVTDGDPHFDCAFSYEGGSTHFRMAFSPTEGWRVFEVYQVAD